MADGCPLTELPAYDEVERAAREAGLGMGASELHGSLGGWLAGGGAGDADWLAKVVADPQQAAPVAGSVLDTLRQASARQLDDRDFAFELLLPDAEASLAERAAALFDWCRGFLGGFGLSAGAQPPLSEEGGEALADLARLAQAMPEQGEDEAEDEDALAEIEEFVRVAVLLLHGDCALAAQRRQRLN